MFPPCGEGLWKERRLARSPGPKVALQAALGVLTAARCLLSLCGTRFGFLVGLEGLSGLAGDLATISSVTSLCPEC